MTRRSAALWRRARASYPALAWMVLGCAQPPAAPPAPPVPTASAVVDVPLPPTPPPRPAGLRPAMFQHAGKRPIDSAMGTLFLGTLWPSGAAAVGLVEGGRWRTILPSRHVDLTSRPEPVVLRPGGGAALLGNPAYLLPTDGAPIALETVTDAAYNREGSLLVTVYAATLSAVDPDTGARLHDAHFTDAWPERVQGFGDIFVTSRRGEQLASHRITRADGIRTVVTKARAVSASGRWLADERAEDVVVLDAATGDEAARYPSEGEAEAIRFASDRHLLRTMADRIDVLDIPAKRRHRVPRLELRSRHDTRTLATSSDGRVLCQLSDGADAIFDLRANRPLVSRPGRRLACDVIDGAAVVAPIRLDPDEELSVIDDQHRFVVNADGSRAAMRIVDQSDVIAIPYLAIVDTATGRILSRIVLNIQGGIAVEPGPTPATLDVIGDIGTAFRVQWKDGSHEPFEPPPSRPPEPPTSPPALPSAKWRTMRAEGEALLIGPTWSAERRGTGAADGAVWDLSSLRRDAIEPDCRGALVQGGGGMVRWCGDTDTVSLTWFDGRAGRDWTVKDVGAPFGANAEGTVVMTTDGGVVILSRHGTRRLVPDGPLPCPPSGPCTHGPVDELVWSRSGKRVATWHPRSTSVVVYDLDERTVVLQESKKDVSKPKLWFEGEHVIALRVGSAEPLGWRLVDGVPVDPPNRHVGTHGGQHESLDAKLVTVGRAPLHPRRRGVTGALRLAAPRLGNGVGDLAYDPRRETLIGTAWNAGRIYDAITSATLATFVPIETTSLVVFLADGSVEHAGEGPKEGPVPLLCMKGHLVVETDLCDAFRTSGALGAMMACRAEPSCRDAMRRSRSADH